MDVAVSEQIHQLIADKLPHLEAEDTEALANQLSARFQQTADSGRLAGGTLQDRIIAWIEEIVARAARGGQSAGYQMKKLLTDPNTLENGALLAAAVALAEKTIPELKEWSVAEVLVVVVLFLRRLPRGEDGHVG